jgi:hypothetical protein
MKREHFERGAVVASLGRNWVVWSYPRARYAEPLALPIVPQTGPRHRSHVRVDLRKRTCVIHTLDLVPLVSAECLLLEQLPFDAIAEIELTMRRAAHARDLEGVR